MIFRIRMALACALFCSTGTARADDWPQWFGPQRDGVWRENGIVETMPKQPNYRWRTPIGAGYAGPAVANGKVYVADRQLKPGAKNPRDSFSRGEVPGDERIQCIDAATGSILWTHTYDCPYRISYPSGPRCTPVVTGGKVYVLGAMGHLNCLNAESGKVIWTKDLGNEYSAQVQLWGHSSNPLVDGDRLICLVGGDATVVAFHKDTGEEIWRALHNSRPGYAPPVIYEIAGVRQLIVWEPEAVHGLDPVTGKVLWSHPFKLHQSNLSIPMPVVSGNRLLVTSFYNGPLLLEIQNSPMAAKEIWRGQARSERPDRTDKLHSIMPTPVIRNGYIYGICSYGQLRCLKLETGERVWESMQATRTVKDGKMTPEEPKPTDEERWGNAFITPQGGRYWLFNEHGDLFLAKLSPAGYEEIGRMNIIAPDNKMARHPVVWSHPAYANRCVFARNDSQVVCVDLAAKR